jgi:chromosome segregation ATPase
MSRVSDTRQRTRQAAAKLVAGGRRPHELTVDLVYAEIRQGSRTTINDELKLWKDEQAKTDALSDALPQPVANAMLAAWAIAVEHGERVFDERRTEVEVELQQANVRADSAETARLEAASTIASIREQIDRSVVDLASARADIQRERDAKDDAQRRTADVEARFAAERADAQSRHEELRRDYEKQLQQEREALAASEARLRDELALATERLEGVQRHVMRQVDEARESLRRAEDQLAKALQRNERLAGDMEPLRTETVTLATQLRLATQEQAVATKTIEKLRAERDDFARQAGSASGRLEAASQQVAELIARLGAPAPALELDVTSDTKKTNRSKAPKAAATPPMAPR